MRSFRGGTGVIFTLAPHDTPPFSARNTNPRVVGLRTLHPCTKPPRAEVFLVSKTMNDHPSSLVAARFARVTLLTALGVLLGAAPVRAFQFKAGEIQGSFDSTLSFGGLYRLQNPSPSNYGTSNSFNGVAGQLNSVNTDDGNLNYGKGWVSELFKGSHDLELKYGDFGAFVRGYWFTDGKSPVNFVQDTPERRDTVCDEHLGNFSIRVS